MNQPPSAAEVAQLYGAVARELSALQHTSGIGATLELWPRYRWIRINEAIATPESRVKTTAMLQQLLQHIRSAQLVTP